MTSPDNQPSGPESRLLEKALSVFVRWAPLGGGIGVLGHFLIQQNWVMSVATFPVTVVTSIWAAYTENFVARCREIASERGRKDVDKVGHLSKLIR